MDSLDDLDDDNVELFVNDEPCVLDNIYPNPILSKPFLLFVPGFWEGPTVSSKVAEMLNSSYNYTTGGFILPSTGTEGANTKTFADDVEAVRSVVLRLVCADREVVLIMHSAGGFIGSEAIKDLGLAQRRQQGKIGGVKKLVFLAGALMPEGSEHQPHPLFWTIVTLHADDLTKG